MKALSSDRIFQGVLQTESFTEEDIAKFCDASVNLVNYPDGYKMEKDGRNEAGRKTGSDIRTGHSHLLQYFDFGLECCFVRTESNNSKRDVTILQFRNTFSAFDGRPWCHMNGM